jgi:GT2 family glycosyltransferase
MSLARNTGASASQGRVVLFLDDDIEPTPGFIEAHMQAHDSCSHLVTVGRLLAPIISQPRGLFMERLHNLDAAFASFLAGRREPLDWFCMIGGNCSMPAILFRESGGFDSSLVTYGGEDYEFACRLQKIGARFRFLPEASGYHYVHENKSVASYFRNERCVGRNDVYIVGRHPEIVDRLRIGLVTRPRTMLGRLARSFAFDRSHWGDPVVKGLMLVCAILAWLRMRQVWNRLMDCISQYWYFRGISDELGGYQAAAAYMTKLKAAPLNSHV